MRYILYAKLYAGVICQILARYILKKKLPNRGFLALGHCGSNHKNLMQADASRQTLCRNVLPNLMQACFAKLYATNSMQKFFAKLYAPNFMHLTPCVKLYALNFMCQTLCRHVLSNFMREYLVKLYARMLCKTLYAKLYAANFMHH